MAPGDLDSIQHRCDLAFQYPWSIESIAASQADVPALIAELRLAREVVKVSRLARLYLAGKADDSEADQVRSALIDAHWRYDHPDERRSEPQGGDDDGPRGH
jgi:hypothetical protein